MLQPVLYDESSADQAVGFREVLDRLQHARGFVFDMDGTLVLSDRSCATYTPLPGAIEITRRLAGRAIPYLVFTNGTALTPKDYARALAKAGIAISPELLMTPATSAADLFVRRGYKSVMTFGGEGVQEPLRAAGLEVVLPKGRVKVDAVFCGWHTEVSMEALQSACHAIAGGASMFSASMTRFFATAEGRTVAPSRATSAMIRDITGCRVTATGKPSLDALRAAARRMGVKVKDLVVVGDDPELEIAMALRGGCLAVAVRTGLGEVSAVKGPAQAQQPHLDLRDLEELLYLYENLC